MGVVRNAMSPQASDQLGDIESPADDPEHRIGAGLGVQQIIQVAAVITALPVGDDLRVTKAPHEAGRLTFNAESTATETTAGAWNQEANEPGGHRFRRQPPPYCRHADGA